MSNDLTNKLKIESKHYARFQRALRLYLANQSKLEAKYDKDLRPAALNELLDTLPREEKYDYAIARIEQNIRFTPKFYLEWIDIKNKKQANFIENSFELLLKRDGFELMRGIKIKSFRDLMIANLDTLTAEVSQKNTILMIIRVIWRRFETFERKLYAWLSDENSGSLDEKRKYATTYIKNNHPRFYRKSMDVETNWAERFVNSTIKIHNTTKDLFKSIDTSYRRRTKRKRSTTREPQLNIQVPPELKSHIKNYAESAKTTEKDFVINAIIYYIENKFGNIHVESKKNSLLEEKFGNYKEITKDIDFKAIDGSFSKMRNK